jgi:CheY-like chemotaxis protein
MDEPMDILIVDDEPDLAEVIRSVLETEGYTCRVASDGRHAIEEVARARPRLVLMDMLMPIMNGWECARELRASYGPGLAIVVMTAAEHARARADAALADEVLTKPFELDELFRVVARYVPAAARAPREPAQARV